MISSIGSTIDTKSVVKKINEPSLSSSLTAIYSLNLVVKGPLLDLAGNNPFNLNENNKVTKKETIKTSTSGKKKGKSSVKKDSEQGVVSKDNNKELTYVMTYGKLGISPNGKTVYFPFLSKIDIKIMKISSLHSINGISWEKAGLTEAVDVSYKNKDGVEQKSVGNKGNKMFNCIVTIDFSIPGVLQNNPSYNYAMIKLALSRELYAEKFVMNYLHDSEELIINDLTSFDFDSGSFNPISSSGFEDLDFTRQFVGYANVVDVDGKRKARDKKLSDQYKLNEELIAKRKSLSNLSGEEKLKASLAYEAQVKRTKELENQYKAANPQVSKPGKEDIPSNYQSKQNGYNYIVSFLPYNIDFKKTYLAEDSAMEDSGFVQVLSVFDDVKNLTTVDYDTFDVKLISPSGRPMTDKLARLLGGSKTDSNKMSMLDNDSGGDQIASSYHETFNSELLGRANPKAFNLILRLPRAILRAEIFQDILIYGSRFGVYDGYWRIFEINLTYEENGQLTQELKIKPKVLTDLGKEKKKAITVKELEEIEKDLDF